MIQAAQIITAILAGIVALLLIFFVLLDVFEVIILPRRVTRALRITVFINRLSWDPLSAIAKRMKDEHRREALLSFYGPLGLLFLLVVWGAGLILGFALLQWALGSPLTTGHDKAPLGFGADLYMSGTTFFTLGLGDVVPNSGLSRVVTVIEAGTGFGILAMVIGYLPVLYQSFSQREVNISLLDARAGSPPVAGELLRRYGQERNIEGLNQFLRDWERWSAELLESHLSYPSLAYFRSQHDNQSWLAALTMILDVCTLVMVGIDDIHSKQARLTFAMARHAAVDLSQILNAKVDKKAPVRLSASELTKLRAMLADANLQLKEGSEADAQLAKLCHQYEPYVSGLAKRLLISLPPWVPAENVQDDWMISAKER